MIDLEERYIQFIKNIVSSYLGEYELYIFGSRAKNRARKYSDVDIAIKSQDFTNEIKSKLEFDFENSTFPYEIDIVNLETISKEFKDLIKDDLLKIN